MTGLFLINHTCRKGKQLFLVGGNKIELWPLTQDLGKFGQNCFNPQKTFKTKLNYGILDCFVFVPTSYNSNIKCFMLDAVSKSVK